MAKQEKGQQNISTPSKVMYQDCSPVNQPEGTYRVMWNGVDQSDTGAEGHSTNESSNELVTNLPTGYVQLGSKYMVDGVTAILSVNPATNKSQIGILTADDNYQTYVDSNLGFRIDKQADIIFRLRQSGRTIYWVDGLNRIRTFNFDKPSDFYTSDYAKYIGSGGNPALYNLEKWDISSFDLIKNFSKIPTFDDVDILEYGNLYPGSYSFAIQYLDEDLNPTSWITTSNTVRIFNDTLDKPYHRIRGSRNTQNDSQNFGRASKSIRLRVGSLDTNFPFYRVAVIEAISSTGKPTRAIGSNPISTATPIFVFSGSEDNYAEVPLTDIILESENISAPSSIEQIENRMAVANGKGDGYNWCEFQAYASKIRSDLVTKQIILNSVESDANQKNVKSSFMFTGNMPGEVYSYGVVYLLPNGIESPVCHVPGKNASDTTSKMLYHELDQGNNYIKIHDCNSSQPYWGVDYMGDPLTGEKIRHHRFPFRNSPGVNKPLIASTDVTTTITKYKLTLKIELDPTQTTWPVDANGDPVVILYTAEYKPNYAASPITVSGYITINNLNSEVVIYDDIYPVNFVSGTDLVVVGATSDLQVNYVNTNLLDYTVINNNYVDSTIQNTTLSEIFGIKFSNIEKPHPDVIGFYIVRQDRQDEDRIVVDNAILGLNLKSQQYRGFGLLMPKVADTRQDPYSNWFFSPEHQFLKKKLNFTSVVPTGRFTETSKDIHEGDYFVFSSGLLKQNRRYFLVEDVYPGTSYNSEVHRKKDADDDGFSLAIGYRNFNIGYGPVAEGDLIMPKINKVMYFDACASKLDEQETYYNTSCDNKIGIIRYSNPISLDYWKDIPNNKSRVLYTSLVTDNKQSYADFITRVYHKEHNNPVLFGVQNVINDVDIFNGDAHISAYNIVNTVFWEDRIGDFNKKDKTWQIVVGAVLIVAGIVLSVVSAGTSLGLTVAGAAALAGLAISYGVSLAVSGFKFEQMKAMIKNDYEKGLKDVVRDQDTAWMYDGQDDYPGPQPAYPNNSYTDTGDDSFIWHADRLSKVWIESSIPAGLRVGLTASVSDFVDAPAPQFDKEEFMSYLTEKLTTVDRDRGSGRLYRGYPTSEVYDTNLDFTRLNKEKLFYHLAIQYDCCNKDGNSETHRNRVWYSEQSFQEEKIDSYRVFLPNNYRDIEGEHGAITDMYKLNNRLFIHTTEGLYLLPASLQERVTGELITFIGTGSFFSVPPQLVTPDGTGGSKHKWATIKTPVGVMFVSENDSKVYLHSGDSPVDISKVGMQIFFEENLVGHLTSQYYNLTKLDFPLDNNPSNPNGVGIHSVYDRKMKRMLITKRDYKLLPQYDLKVYPEQLSFTTLVTPTIEPHKVGFDTIANRFFLYQVVGGFNVFHNYISLTDGNYFENKSWTISFSLDNKGWKSFHSSLPTSYIQSNRSFYAMYPSNPGIYKHNKLGHYQTFGDVYYKHIIETVCVTAPLVTKVWCDLMLQTIAQKYDPASKEFVEIRNVTFNKIMLFTARQCSGPLTIKVKDDELSKNYLSNQVRDNRGTEILIDRNQRDWTLNNIRDYRTDYTKPLFNRAWEITKTQYPIDKVINPLTISANKPWTQLEVFRDKFLVVRLEFDNFADISLTTNYILDSIDKSDR